MAGELRSRARAETAHAARYMTQLAKHWGHKYEVAFDQRQARIVLPLGLCLMVASPDSLEVTIEAADEETLTRLEGVVARHLARFSFREPDLALEWTRLAPGQVRALPG